MKNKYPAFYVTSLFIIIAASVYPIYMGITVFRQYLTNGFVETANYPKYIIPYTPMCIAIIVCTLLLPLLYKIIKRYSVLILSALGIALFIAGELFFEQIKVLEGYKKVPLESWQLSLCIATPEVLMAIGEPIYAENNPSFKVHFYIIAIVIILIVVGILYGFTRMLKEGLYEKKKPLIMQTVSVIIFIALCILACFTAFFRNGTLYIGVTGNLPQRIFEHKHHLTPGFTSRYNVDKLAYFERFEDVKEDVLVQLRESKIDFLTFTQVVEKGKEYTLTWAEFAKFGVNSLSAVDLSNVPV